MISAWKGFAFLEGLCHEHQGSSAGQDPVRQAFPLRVALLPPGRADPAERLHAGGAVVAMFRPRAIVERLIAETEVDRREGERLQALHDKLVRRILAAG